MPGSMAPMAPPDALKPVYATFGDDRPKVERTLARLLLRLRNEGGLEPDRFNARETPVEEIVAACQALSFGGSRAVIVEGADGWRAAEAEAVVRYLDDPNPATVLMLVSAAAPPQKLLHAVERVGTVLRWGPDERATRPRERRAWLEEYLRGEIQRLGGQAQPAAVRRVVDLLVTIGTRGELPPGATLALAAEAEKLVAYAGGAVIDVEAVDAMVPAHPEARVYELADALTAGRRTETYGLLQDLASGDDRVAPIVVQSGLVRHFRALVAAQDLGPGASPDAVARATGLNGYPARKVAEQAAALPTGAAGRALVRLARLELDLRVGAEAQLGTSPDDGQRFALERAVRDVLVAVGAAPSPPARAASARAGAGGR